jgi:hypothetical protein
LKLCNHRTEMDLPDSRRPHPSPPGRAGVAHCMVPKANCNPRPTVRVGSAASIAGERSGAVCRSLEVRTGPHEPCRTTPETPGPAAMTHQGTTAGPCVNNDYRFAGAVSSGANRL